jgi:hypothetical protein
MIWNVAFYGGWFFNPGPDDIIQDYIWVGRFALIEALERFINEMGR